MLLNKVTGERTDDVDSQIVLPGVLKRRGDELESDAFSALFFGNLSVPDRHPSVPVGLELEVADLAILFDLKPASSYLGRFIHVAPGFQMTESVPATHWC